MPKAKPKAAVKFAKPKVKQIGTNKSVLLSWSALFFR